MFLLKVNIKYTIIITLKISIIESGIFFNSGSNQDHALHLVSYLFSLILSQTLSFTSLTFLRAEANCFAECPKIRICHI